MTLTFADLFCGIGGFRIAAQNVGMQCVYSADNEKFCAETYKAWFGDDCLRDLRGMDYSTLPDFDVLFAGFPCQPFSIAGVVKRESMGVAHGLEGEKGDLFKIICEVLVHKKPRAFLLENVPNLLRHDKGKTWEVIERSLAFCGYHVGVQLVDASCFVPQRRKRAYIVGLRADSVSADNVHALRHWQWPEFPEEGPPLWSVLEDYPDAKYTLTDTLWEYLQAYRAKHHAAGNGFGFSIADLNGATRTLSARYGKDGSEILIAQDDVNPRRLTPHECKRLMGFPDNLPIVVSDTQAYKQFGNAVVVPVVERFAERLKVALT